MAKSSDFNTKNFLENQASMNEAMNDPDKYLKRKQASLENIALPMVEAKGNVQKDVAGIQSAAENKKVDYLTSQTAFDREYWLNQVKNQPGREEAALDTRVAESKIKGLGKPRIEPTISGTAGVAGPSGTVSTGGTAVSTVEKMGRMPGTGDMSQVEIDKVNEAEKLRKKLKEPDFTVGP